jgi:hypothetical protein
MPIEVLSIGPIQTMRANVVYALPAVNVTMYTDGATPTMTQSLTQAFTANTPVTFTAGVASPTGAFIKATADTLVILKRD